MARTTHIAAVYEDETAAFLHRLGLEDAYQSGALTCSVCGTRSARRTSAP